MAKVKKLKEAVIVSAARTPMAHVMKGGKISALKEVRPDELARIAMKEALDRTKGLDWKEIDDVILGTAFPEGPTGMNVARRVLLRVGIPYTVPGVTINRFCSTGLQAIAFAAERIMCGFADVIVAGGVESMSTYPMGEGTAISVDPDMGDEEPNPYVSMGITAENVAEKFNISREDQDKFALESNLRACRAIKEGKFKDQIVPVKVKRKWVDDEGKVREEEKIFDMDNGPRCDASLKVMATLRPVFKKGGTVTAGNSSQMTDGAAVVVVMSKEKANELGLKPLGRFHCYAVAGVPPEIMGIGPSEAVPKVFKMAGMKLDQIELIELNEAFASQSVYCIRKLGLNPDIVNVNGGAIALGHPLGCAGAKLTIDLLYEMKRRDAHWGIVTMCIGGGMGAAAILERI